MKNITKSLILFMSILTISCTTDDVQDRPIIQGIDSPVLSAPENENAYVLLPENMAMQAERFVWTSANYNGAVAVTYTVEMDVEGGDFSAPKVIGGANSANQSGVSVETLNNAALQLGASPFVASNFDVRVTSSASGFDTMASNVVTITITTYTTETPKLYVTGNFLSNSGYGDNWNAANGVPISASAFGQTDFEGFVNINEANYAFLFLPTNTSFDNKFGDDGTFSGTLAPNGSDILGTGPNYYLVKANTTTLTYSLQPTQWAITGSATPLGWPDNGVQDQNMTYNAATKKWEIILAMTAGGNKFKFRANDDWALNLGADSADEDTSMDFGGSDLEVPAAGNYKIELDLSSPRNYSWTATPQ